MTSYHVLLQPPAKCIPVQNVSSATIKKTCSRSTLSARAWHFVGAKCFSPWDGIPDMCGFFTPCHLVLAECHGVSAVTWAWAMFPDLPFSRLRTWRFPHLCTLKCTQLMPNKCTVLPRLPCVSEASLVCSERPYTHPPLFFFSFVIFWPFLQHMEVPRLGVKSEL